MTWENYIRGQDAVAFGGFLIDVVADLYGCEHRPEAIATAVYKATACGAWCKFDEAGILVGTIVEGSEAEYSTRIMVDDLDCDEDSAETLAERFQAAIQNCEDFSDQAEF